MNKALIALIFIAISVAMSLAGCTGLRRVDNQVNSFALQPVPPSSAYRFERLPSQETDAAAQAQLETMAEAVLAKVGLQRDDEAANYTVLVTATQRGHSVALDRPALSWNLGRMMGHGGMRLGHGPLFPGLDSPTQYWREVGLMVRSLHTQVVVFETRATHDGPWADSAAILPAMLDAALQGFPNPPAGPRQVDIDIAR
jgi:hypothetical protein